MQQELTAREAELEERSREVDDLKDRVSSKEKVVEEVKKQLTKVRRNHAFFFLTYHKLVD